MSTPPSITWSLSSNRRFAETNTPFLLTPCKALADLRVVLCGQSHAHAVARALVGPSAPGEPPGAPGLALAHGMAALISRSPRPEYHRLMLALGRTRRIGMVWRGNQHHSGFLVNSGEAFDLLPRNHPNRSVLPGVRILPEASVRAHFASGILELRNLLAEFAPHPAGPHLVIGTPPPLGDAAVARRRLFSEPSFGARATALGVAPEDVVFTPPAVLQKLWFVVQEMLAETAAEAGALFIAVPPEAADAQGCLPTELSAGDITHANGIYGAIMVARIAAALGQPEAAPAAAPAALARRPPAAQPVQQGGTHGPLALQHRA